MAVGWGKVNRPAVFDMIVAPRAVRILTVPSGYFLHNPTPLRQVSKAVAKNNTMPKEPIKLQPSIPQKGDATRQNPDRIPQTKLYLTADIQSL